MRARRLRSPSNLPAPTDDGDYSRIGNGLDDFALPQGLTNLTMLDLTGNGLTNLALPEGLRSLQELNAWDRHLNKLELPEGLSNLNMAT